MKGIGHSPTSILQRTNGVCIDKSPACHNNACRYIVFIMPLAWVLCRQFGPVGVWNAFWATEVLSAIVSLIVYKKSV